MVTNITTSLSAQKIGDPIDGDRKLKNIIDEAFDEYNAKQSRSEIRTVAHILSDVEPQTVVEIGTAEGGSLFVWSQYLGSVDYIVSIDKSHSKNSIEKIKSMSKASKILCINNISQDITTVNSTHEFIQPNGIDFLFIDGGSTKHEVRADYENFSDMINPGGIIAFHDILTHRERPGSVEVNEVWKEVREDASEFVEITETSDATKYGYGLMYF